MAYLAAKPLTVWLRAGLAPLLLLMTLTASTGADSNAEPEQYPHIERYEHKMTQPARLHGPLPKSVPFMRSAHHGNPLPVSQDTGLPVCFVLLYPQFYNRLKRLLLRPLKYTSNYVEVYSSSICQTAS
ncbi:MULTISPECIES: hypothetical protein [unclassified Paenibacillus]|uniref:hypothetical protein n=1 Tax=unclassified Paenibacillus TaxID=185978 RepID=UPI002404E910|nr:MULTISPECIES: hypothetical protein [unclassified Paenibacillus]MDF9842919.1 hypothetical protein [Paenibacillus sp. PastF-2]MDF9849507.1 hypothetical protein [Paenibacillus sp. PastM-2]MDF9856118.1 hypothetical protein [Paenibacillus sp. PastF-1]MDH6481350.1 hypothetical protein [Paenibacillus sp. PastH-2]MDH6508807.1 hypothetical protein [Paenibacillus sp. PastM-3]